MLYDPKWEAPTKVADPMSLDTLIAWLEKQPANQEYAYTCNGHCLLAQYFTAMGLKNVLVWGDAFYHGEKAIPRLTDQRDAIRAGIATELPRSFHDTALFGKHTFGAALARAKSFAEPQ